MIYIYDILANLNKELFFFYDWNTDDEIIHIKKIPLLKLSNNVYNLVLSKSLKTNHEFLRIILNKTEIYNNKIIEEIKYATIFTNGRDAIIVSFNNDGSIDEVSRMLVEEELEVLELSKNMKSFPMDFEIVNKKLEHKKLIRSDELKIRKILETISMLEEKEEQEKLKYLYFEWFSIHPKTLDYIKELKYDLSLEYTDKHKIFESILNLISIKK